MSNGILHVMMLSSNEMKMGNKEIPYDGPSHVLRGLSFEVYTEKLSSATSK